MLFQVLTGSPDTLDSLHAKVIPSREGGSRFVYIYICISVLRQDHPPLAHKNEDIFTNLLPTFPILVASDQQDEVNKTLSNMEKQRRKDRASRFDGE